MLVHCVGKGSRVLGESTHSTAVVDVEEMVVVGVVVVFVVADCEMTDAGGASDSDSSLTSTSTGSSLI